MLMIIAVDNNEIEEKIKEEYYLTYEILVIKSKDALLALYDEYKGAILIIRDNLKGNVSFESTIKYIKNVDNNIHIIVITEKITQEYKEFLFSKEIFNIVEGENISIENISENIHNKKLVTYKNKSENKKSNIIIVTGAKNSGKTICSLNIANYISKIRKDKKVLLIDLDFQNPSIYIYLKSHTNYGLKDLIKDFEQNSMRAKINYEDTNSRVPNLMYILNNIPMNEPNTKTIFSLIDLLGNLYDYVIIDTSFFLMNKIYKRKEYNIIHVIKDSVKGYKDYLYDTINLEKNSKVKLLFNCKRKGIKRADLTIESYVKTNIFLDFIDKYKFVYRNSNIKTILKVIGIKKKNKFKELLIRKLNETGDDIYEG